MLGVDDQPSHRLRPEFADPSIQRPTEVVARARLVGEPAAARIHHETVRRSQRLLGVPNLALGVPQAGTPPRVAHASQLQPQFGGPLELPDAFAARLAQRPSRTGRRRQELAARRGVPLEAALGDDDAPPGKDPNRAHTPTDLDADHSIGDTVLIAGGQQPTRRRIPPDVHLQTLTGCQQPDHQGGTTVRGASAPGRTTHRAGGVFQAVDQRVCVRRHPVGHHLGELSDHGGLDRLRHHDPLVRPAAREQRVVIAHPIGVQPNAQFGQPTGQRPGSGQEGMPARRAAGRVPLTHHTVEVVTSGCVVVVDAVAGRQPELARPARLARAEPRPGLYHQDLPTGLPAGDRSGQGSGVAADHHHIGHLVGGWTPSHRHRQPGIVELGRPAAARPVHWTARSWRTCPRSTLPSIERGSSSTLMKRRGTL